MTRKRKQTGSSGTGPITYETVREIARAAGAVEGTSYGTPAFRVGNKLRTLTSLPVVL